MCPGCVLAAAPAHLLHVVRATNDYIARTHDRASMFATVFLGALDPETGVLDYVNVGHDAPVIAQSDGEMVRLHPTGPALGLLPDADFEVGKAQLEPGSTLLAFTDGFADAHDQGGVSFGEDRLLALLADPTPSPSELLDRMEDAVRDFS